MLPITILSLLCLAAAGVASDRGPNHGGAEPKVPEEDNSYAYKDENLWVANAPSARQTRAVARRLLITLKTSPESVKTGKVDSLTINTLAGISSLANVKDVKRISPRAGIHLVTLSSAKAAENTIRELKKNEGVESVEHDRLLHISDVNPDDPFYRNGDLWGIEKINAPSAWDVGTGSKDVVVCVIDTGVDYNHLDLADNMWRNPGETGLDSQGRDKATNGVDDDGNGVIDGEF